MGVVLTNYETAMTRGTRRLGMIQGIQYLPYIKEMPTRIAGILIQIE